jgi:putative two-component system response regulator
MTTNHTPAVLIVDDDELQRQLMARLLARDYDCSVAAGVEEARAKIAEQEFALVLCDINMPGDSGLDLARELADTRPEIAVTMVTGVDDPAIAQQALESGALDYIVKPYRATELRIGVANSLHRRRLEMAAGRHLSSVEADLKSRTSELESTLVTLEESRLDAIQRLCLAVEARDLVTSDHVMGMVDVVERLALALNFPPDEAKALGMAASMHDVGKIGVPDAILLKPGPLTDEERHMMQRHSEIGFHILDGSPNHVLQLGATIALAHHERYDGTGYPYGMVGGAIPLAARIVQIIDVYSALTSMRPYRGALPVETALEMIGEGAGSQFDPEIVNVFLSSFESIVEKATPPSHSSGRQYTDDDSTADRTAL